MLGPGEGREPPASASTSRPGSTSSWSRSSITDGTDASRDAAPCPPPARRRLLHARGEMMLPASRRRAHTVGAGELVFAPPDSSTASGALLRPSALAQPPRSRHGLRQRLLGDGSFEFDQHDPPDDGGRPAEEGRSAARGPSASSSASRHAVCSEASGDRLDDVVEVDVPARRPGPAAPPHDETVDSFYVIEGELGVLLGEERARRRARQLRPGAARKPCTPARTPASGRPACSVSRRRAGSTSTCASWPRPAERAGRSSSSPRRVASEVRHPASVTSTISCVSGGIDH